MNEGTQGKTPVRRALISVYDKTGLEQLARGLHEAGVEIVSTGSTASTIASFGVPVTPVEQVTGFPEILGGRVKTLHPNVHAGLLADQGDPEHVRVIEKLGIAPFQLFIGNLYPFAETVARGASTPEVIEQIDIGGPAMVRASAKNYGSVAVVVNPDGYGEVLEAVQAGGFTLEQRQRLMAEAFQHTAAYDIAVANYAVQTFAPSEDGLPDWTATVYMRDPVVLRYGENPHQKGAMYHALDLPGAFADAEVIHGKPMSYNNWTDGNAAWRAVHDHGDQPCVAIIKHQNPCGIAVGDDVAEAYRKAHECDPLSAFGGVVASNQAVTVAMATLLDPIFTEVLMAPDFEDGVLELLAHKKDLRILKVSAPPSDALEFAQIDGGMVLQTPDAIDQPGDEPSGWELKAGEAADEATLADLQFAWRAVRAVKSNGILLASDGASVGVGMGQVNRVDSCGLAVDRAGDRAHGSVAASDAFFPESDGPLVLIEAGVTAIVVTGGSKKDQATIDVCREYGVRLYFTGVRHFAH